MCLQSCWWRRRENETIWDVEAALDKTDGTVEEAEAKVAVVNEAETVNKMEEKSVIYKFSVSMQIVHIK